MPWLLWILRRMGKKNTYSSFSHRAHFRAQRATKELRAQGPSVLQSSREDVTVLPKASLPNDTKVIYPEVRESGARATPSHHCPCLPSLLPVRDGAGRDAAGSRSLSVGGDKSTASFFQVDKLAFCRRGISQTNRCLSAVPGARPPNRPCFVTTRRKKEKEIKERKAMCSEQHIHPSGTLRRQVE